MTDPRTTTAEERPATAGIDSQQPAGSSSRESALLRDADLLAKLFWNVHEVAFIARVGVRTVWRMVADPKSGFPIPRRLRGRTLFASDQVLAFLNRRGGAAS